MLTRLLTTLQSWLSAKLIPWYAPYWNAKKLHEGSPHGLFTRGKGLYRSLTAAEIEAAARCPRLARAVELYEECIDRERSEERVLNHGIALHQLGLLLHRQGRLGEARGAYEDALAVLEDLPHDVLPAISTCHFRLAELSLESGDRNAALEHLQRSRDIDTRLRDAGGLAMNDELRQMVDPGAAP